MEPPETTQALGTPGLVPVDALGGDSMRSPRSVPLAGLEPATTGLEIPCSIRLSYRGLVAVGCLIIGGGGHSRNWAKSEDKAVAK